MSLVHGEPFRRVAFTEAEYEDIYRHSIFWTDSNFYDEYRKHMIAMSHVANCAKIYVLKNWEKVKDWSNLDIVIKHAGAVTEYFNNEKEPEETAADSAEKDSPIVEKLKVKTTSHSPIFEEFMNKMREEDKLRHNPIVSVSDVVLDPSDGDFSVTINGNKHLWLLPDEVIIIANYVENFIKKAEHE